MEIHSWLPYQIAKMTPVQMMAACGVDVSEKIVHKTLQDFVNAGGMWPKTKQQ